MYFKSVYVFGGVCICVCGCLWVFVFVGICVCGYLCLWVFVFVGVHAYIILFLLIYSQTRTRSVCVRVCALHWRRLVKHIGGAIPIFGGLVVKTDKCMDVHHFFGGGAPELPHQ